MIDWCVNMFDCAQFRRSRERSSWDLGLDGDGELPCAVMIEEKVNDVKVPQSLSFRPEQGRGRW